MIESTEDAPPAAAERSSDGGAASPFPEGGETPWDHTSKKVVVHGVLKFMRPKEITKMTKAWLEGRGSAIRIAKTKKPPKESWVKVTLVEEGMVAPFIELINKGGEGGKPMSNGRGAPLFAKRAEEMFNDGRDSRGDERVGNCGKRNGGENDGVDGRDGQRGNKRSKREERPIRILSTDEVRDAITPLWRMPYEQQLDQMAREMINKCSKKIIKEIKGKFRTLEREAKRGQRKGCTKPYDWLTEKRAIEMEQPIPSPKRYEYRNKCEFTVGYKLVQIDWPGEGVIIRADVKHEVEDDSAEAEVADDGQKTATANGYVAGKGGPNAMSSDNFEKIPAVGFLAQGWSGGVYPPHCLQNMPDWSCGIADIFNEFLPTSPIPPYDSKVHRGVWRTITLRCSLRTRECMVIVQHAPAKGGVGALGDGSDDYSNVFDGEKARLVEMLTKGVIPTPKRDYSGDDVGSEAEEKAGSEEGICVTSIFLQEFDGLSSPSPEHPVQHVYGKKSLQERLGSCNFQISPGAFFQVNTEGAEVLYNIVVERIKEVTTDPQKTLLLDVCCGTGTIGLTCLKEGVVGRLVGVDIAEPAIEDAKINAEGNGFTETSTTEFVASPAEKILPDMMRDLPRNSPVVAVVDPARDGLHGFVVRALRANEKIQRLVYVSCNPTGTLARDAAMLCGPPTKKYPGRPFRPTMSQPVDMFPLTKHCEMVMTLDRMSDDEYKKYHTT